MRQMILNFHGIGDPPAAAHPSERALWWDEIPFNNLLDQVCAARRGNDVSIALTFDDGNISDARIALPALVKRGLTAKFFVCAGRIGQSNYVDEPALADLLSAGMSIGSHGMSHIDWRQASAAELEQETTESRRVLEDVCGRCIDEVAIPFGSYDRRVIGKLRRQDWKSVYTSDGGDVLEGAWFKPRNTLSRGSQGGDVGALLYSSTVGPRLRRVAAILWKRMR